jgi:hypothetical protein
MMKHLRYFLAAALLAFAGLASAQTTMLSAVTVTGAGSSVLPPYSGTKQFQAVGATTAGAGSVSVAVQCSLDGTNYDTIGTITLTLSTTPASNNFNSNDRCRLVRGNVTAISGTGASVSLYLGM